MNISEVWKGEDRKKLADLMLQDEGLSTWEANFLDDISHQSYPPTVRQLETMNKIYERIFK